MRVKEIHMTNYRQYQNMTFCFPKMEGKKDLHIIVAQNGVGKSNILNAICWCLYGKEPHLRDEYTAIFRPNSHMVNLYRQQGKDKIEVGVELKICTDENRDICFSRTELYNIPSSGQPVSLDTQLTILKTEDNGDTKTYTDQMETVSLVKEYIPEEINEYIFFDGDRLEHFFKKEYLANVRDGINNLTQATLIERSVNGFSKFIKEELEPVLVKCGNQDVRDLQLRVLDQEKIVKNARSTIEEIRNQISICDVECAKLDAVIREHEKIGEYDNQLKNVTEQIDTIEKDKRALNERMMDFVRDYYPLFKLFPYIKKYYAHLVNENNNTVLLVVDPSELHKIIKTGTCSVCGQPVVEDTVINHIKELIASSVSVASAIKIKDKESIKSAMQKLLSFRTKKDEFVLEERNLLVRKKKLEEEQEKIQKYMNSVPAPEVIMQAVRDREQYRNSKEENLQKLGVERLNFQVQEAELEKRTAALDEALAKAKDLKVIQNRINYCKHCINILEQTKKEVLEESRQELQDETYKVFTSLLWKVGVFTGFEIKKDYSVWLYDEYNNQTAGSASSAETNLLALAFTLSLQKVSHHDSLLFIDTPTGRVDPMNRVNFMEALMKIPDKQMVLLFTQSEYTEEMRTIINGDYSTCRELQIMDKNVIKKEL